MVLGFGGPSNLAQQRELLKPKKVEDDPASSLIYDQADESGVVLA